MDGLVVSRSVLVELSIIVDDVGDEEEDGEVVLGVVFDVGESVDGWRIVVSLVSEMLVVVDTVSIVVGIVGGDDVVDIFTAVGDVVVEMVVPTVCEYVADGEMVVGLVVSRSVLVELSITVDDVEATASDVEGDVDCVEVVESVLSSIYGDVGA